MLWLAIPMAPFRDGGNSPLYDRSPSPWCPQLTYGFSVSWITSFSGSCFSKAGTNETRPMKHYRAVHGLASGKLNLAMLKGPAS